MNAVGPETEDMKRGCWPQKMQLPNLMYLCNFPSYFSLDRKKIQFPQMDSDTNSQIHSIH